MDTLKGKKIMVWTFMGNTRMYNALRDYGDRISQIGLFSFKVRATGEIYETGVSISSMMTYINMWPHIKWLLTISNDGYNSIFAALRDNTDGAQDMFLSEIVRIMEKYPWCDGIDIDLEKGDGYSTHAASTQMFANIYNTVKAYDSTKLMNICLPGMTSVNGSVGGDVQMGADLTDEAVLAVEVHVLQQLVLIVAGHQIADAADQQACHRSLLLSEEYPPKDRGIFGRFTGLPGSSSGPERWGADPPASCAGTR